MNPKILNRIGAALSNTGTKNKELAKLLNVKDVTVSRWKHNVQQPPLDKLFKIAEVLNVPVCSLLNKAYNPNEDYE